MTQRIPTPSQARPAVFLDRDGTLMEDRGHIRSPSEVIFFPDSPAALQRLGKQFLLFIVTNQPGVAEGVVTMEEVERVHAHVVAQLAQWGIHIHEVYVCPHRRSENCGCIKPRPYFLLKAAESYGLDLSRSFVVGDHPHDMDFAHSVGASGVYVLTGHGAKHRSELADPTLVVPGIRQAADWILTHSSGSCF
ncbi:MAG: HAD family hydrolase [Planctomycetes bacterium]|nr:HAD family hydrolase [Planctomycetota bacterium]MBM4078244.1 HAD family hydrolase [Planctomycetota bacterium]